MRKRTNKFNAKKVMHKGIKFDSQMEADFYDHLEALKESGEIKDFTLQPKFQLQPPFTAHGVKYVQIYYKADFMVYYEDRPPEVIDVKGHETADFKIKAKMFRYQYPHKLILVTKAPKYMGVPWVTLEELKEVRKKRKEEKG